MLNETDFQKALDLFDKSNNILLATHTRPDGDACGCIAAVGEILTKLGKNVSSILLSEVPEWYRFIYEQTPPVLGADITIEQLKESFTDIDLIMLLDVNSKSQLPGLVEILEQNKKPILVIDHHPTSDGLGDVELVDTTAAATG